MNDGQLRCSHHGITLQVRPAPEVGPGWLQPYGCPLCVRDNYRLVPIRPGSFDRGHMLAPFQQPGPAGEDSTPPAKE